MAINVKRTHLKRYNCGVVIRGKCYTFIELIEPLIDTDLERIIERKNTRLFLSNFPEETRELMI